MTTQKVQSILEEDGRLLRVQLDAPPGNVLDREMLDGLSSVLHRIGSRPALRAIIFESTGKNFSFGASVVEHTRARAGDMLSRFHRLFHDLDRLSVPTLAVVRGQCLGGGLELASWCGWIFAAPDAKLGQPEIRLAVFPPMASLLLPWRLGGARGLDLCVSGRIISAREAEAMGLVHEVSEDPGRSALEFAREHLLDRSSSSLRIAERVSRLALRTALKTQLPALERLYLDELMATYDANEGIAAFLEKRPPSYENASEENHTHEPA